MKTTRQYTAPSVKVRPLCPEGALMAGSGPTGGDGGGTTPGFTDMPLTPDEPTFSIPIKHRDIWEDEEEDEVAEQSL